MSEPSGTRIDLGPASAYAYAVANGYTGTEAEFGAYLAQASTKASETVINAAAAAVDALKAEGYAVGKQGGVDVDSQSGYFENNAKYWALQSAASAGSISVAEVSDVLTYLGI